VEREKPAHTAYAICLVDPGLRVGYQALLGIDTILGGEGSGPATRLGEDGARGLVIGGAPAGRIGTGRVGESTRLGQGAVEGRFSTGADRPMREETPWAQ
jgi:hypothetical protein